MSLAGFGIASLCGCVGVATTVATTVASAALQTAIEQAQKNRPTPEQLWHDAQVANLERNAVAGNVDAQYQLGSYYLVLREPRGADWVCQAAIQGHPQAQLQYGHFFNEDRKRGDLFPYVEIAPDNVQAFLWYSLATRGGEPEAAHFRDSLLSGSMSAQRIDLAEATLAAWTPSSCAEFKPSTLMAGGALPVPQ